jgi:sec-independent protein translocase protein TatC
MKEELAYIKRMALRLVLVFAALVVACMAVPLAGSRSVVELAFEHMRVDLVPPDVALIITNPIEAFVTQVAIAVFIALFAMMPFMLLELWRFVSPGLYGHERRGLVWFVLVALVLWYTGTVFAYLMLIPSTFSALYGFLPPGVMPLFSLRELVSLTAGLTLMAGVAFLLPVAMVLLTRVGLVPASFWRAHTRHALVLVLVASAIITPDGSGVSMAFLTLPVGALYAAGYAGAKFYSPRITN